MQQGKRRLDHKMDNGCWLRLLFSCVCCFVGSWLSSLFLFFSFALLRMHIRIAISIMMMVNVNANAPTFLYVSCLRFECSSFLSRLYVSLLLVFRPPSIHFAHALSPLLAFWCLLTRRVFPPL